MTQTGPDSLAVTTGLDPELIGWIQGEIGGRVTAVDRRPGGGRREAWYVDVTMPDGVLLELFLRYDRTDREAAGDPFTLHDEARYFQALQDTPVPVPEIHAVHPVEQAILSSRVSGHTWFSQLKDENERLTVAHEFMTVLAALHDVDPHVLDVPGQDPDADLRDLVRRELGRWEDLYREGKAPADPLIELGLRWLRANVPDVSGPVVIVQGDTGPGNFLYEDGHVTAVLDWELAHLGDPHDDLAWVSQRAIQEPFTSLPERLADYASASGRDIDLDRIWYYRVFASVRILVLGHNKVGNADPLSEVGNSLIYGALHRRICVEALAHVLGVPLDPPSALSAPPTSREWLYDAALAQLGSIIVPRSTDPFVIQRSKGLARILKYLREASRLEGLADIELLDDVQALLGTRPSGVDEALTGLLGALDEGRLSPAQVVRVLHRQVIRDTQILRPAMGALADRHYDPLTDDTARG